MKVLYYTNLTVPYRKDFFSELGKYCDLTVWVETERRWNSNSTWLQSGSNDNYSLVVLPRIKFSKDKFINYGYGKPLKESKFDAIIVGTYYSLSSRAFIEYLSVRRIPFILNSDGGFIKNDTWIKKAVKSHYMSKASAYLSTGKLTSEYLKYYGGEKKTYWYPFTSTWKADLSTVVLSDVEKHMMLKRLGVKEKRMILSVGSCIYRKGYDLLIKAVEELDSSIGIYIIGAKETDDQIEYLKDYIKAHNIENVHLISFLTKDELKKYYQAASLFILPTREDIWGLVINEAAANGLPIITTRRCIAGCEIVKEDINGFLVANDDAESLKDAICKIIYDPKKLYEMGCKSRKIAETYTIENMALEHHKALRDFLKLNN